MQLILFRRVAIAPEPNFSSNASVVSELLVMAERLGSIVVADAPTSSQSDAVAFAQEHASDRLYLIYPNLINSSAETVPASPYVAGVIAKSDNENGFWCSPSNKKISGILGLSTPIDFSLGDSSCRANYLNSQNITTIINEDGYRVWGNRTTSTDTKYQFLCIRRTADIINESILQSHLWAVDRNIVKNYLTDVTESVNAFLNNLKSQGAILYGKCYADPDLNNSTNIADGKVYFDFEFTPAFPAELVTFRAYLNNENIESILLENLAI